MVRILLAALIAAPALAAPADAATPRDRLVQLVECHAFTAQTLASDARALSAGAAWSAAHQSLWSRGRAHDVVTRVLRRAMDGETGRMVLAAHFPEGLETATPEERVERRQRCRKLYAEIVAQEARAGRSAPARTPFDTVR
jgi:hypothetical protein